MRTLAAALDSLSLALTTHERQAPDAEFDAVLSDDGRTVGLYLSVPGRTLTASYSVAQLQPFNPVEIESAAVARGLLLMTSGAGCAVAPVH